MKEKLNRMIWDIEVSPNIGAFWRAGYKLRVGPHNITNERAIICICWKWEGSSTVQSLRWDNGDDKAMLEAFLPEMDKANEMVAHNGDKFDLRFFKGRCLKHGLHPAIDTKTVDTYAIVKRRFDLNAYSLAYLAQYLGIEQGKGDMEFQDWIDITIHHKRSALNKMVRYCKQDVNLLEAVWQKLSPHHNLKTHLGVFRGDEKWTCPECASSNVRQNKKHVTTAGTPSYEFRCNSCRRYYRVSSSDRQKYVEYKYA